MVLVSLFFNYLVASNVDLQHLKQQFHDDVILTSIYKKRFNKFLKQNCKDNNKTCLEEQINRLQGWETTKKDESLKYLLNNKIKHISIEQNYWNRLHKKLKKNQNKIKNSQFVSVIDIKNQLFIVTIWDENSQKFYYIGSDLISSGNMNREAEVKKGEDHFLKTPVGFFRSKGGWRSDGKIYKDTKAMPYGEKDRFVFYFGKQKSIRYNTFDKNGNKIKNKNHWKVISDELDFAVHAHKSSTPLGKEYSHGCVRMSDELNLFLDNNLVLHKNMFNGKKWLHKYDRAPLDPKNFELAGEYLIIFDKI